jgi:hypothetical protein
VELYDLTQSVKFSLRQYLVAAEPRTVAATRNGTLDFRAVTEGSGLHSRKADASVGSFIDWRKHSACHGETPV